MFFTQHHTTPRIGAFLPVVAEIDGDHLSPCASALLLEALAICSSAPTGSKAAAAIAASADAWAELDAIITELAALQASVSHLITLSHPRTLSHPMTLSL